MPRFALVFLGLHTTAALLLVKRKLRPNLLWKNELLNVKTLSTTVMSRPKGKRKIALAKSSL